ncbi:hypothetical protein RFI_20817, partial [Reticulomyxa filosa]
MTTTTTTTTTVTMDDRGREHDIMKMIDQVTATLSKQQQKLVQLTNSVATLSAERDQLNATIASLRDSNTKLEQTCKQLQDTSFHIPSFSSLPTAASSSSSSSSISSSSALSSLQCDKPFPKKIKEKVAHVDKEEKCSSKEEQRPNKEEQRSNKEEQWQSEEEQRWKEIFEKEKKEHALSIWCVYDTPQNQNQNQNQVQIQMRTPPKAQKMQAQVQAYSPSINARIESLAIEKSYMYQHHQTTSRNSPNASILIFPPNKQSSSVPLTKV